MTAVTPSETEPSATAPFEARESSIRGYCRAWPAVFVRASGARQIDEDGRSYIDFFAGAGVLNFGHNDPRMKRAMLDYLEGDGILHSLDMFTGAKRAFIERFTRTVLEPRQMPHKLQFMGPTGTNAVEVALKLARRVTGRRPVIAFHHAFHGMTLGSLALTANSYFRDASGVPLEHVVHAPFGCEAPCRGCELGCGDDALTRLRAVFGDSSSGVPAPAAIVLETIQAEGGVRVASAAWLQAAQQLARDLGALLIVDEIQVGCGRTGSYFSFDGMDLDPDIVCLAKGIGGAGTPMAMNLVKPEHDEHWSPGEHTGTFRGQNLSFVAGAEALSYFEDDALMTEVRRKSGVMREACERIVAAHPARPLQLRGRGMIFGLDIGDGDASKAIARRCFENQLLISPCGAGGRVLKLIPPLTIPDEDLTAGLATLEAACAAELAR